MFKKIIALSCILLLLCGALLSCAKSDVEVPEDMQSATLSGEPFYLFVPLNWTPNLSSGVSSAYISSTDTILVSARHFTAADGLTLDEYMSNCAEGYAATYDSFEKVEQVAAVLGGEDAVEEQFGKPVYKLRQEWRKDIEDQTLTQQMQQEIASKVTELTPYDVQKYIDETDVEDLPVVPVKYQLSQICIYPDREAANLAVKERLLAIRERIINGEKFSTLARIYSQDPGSARRGGELGMASKSIFWPVFSDAAMSLKPGVVSQIVETPDGFHIIEVLEKKGDMFNARHILLKPEYTSEDRTKAFHTLDSLRTELANEAVTFGLAARFYSEDLATRTNGGQMADPNTGSSYFEIDQLKPQDYAAIKDLKEGEISEPVESLDNEGRNGNTVYKIIKVDKIIPAHPASFSNDYTLLMEQAKQAKQMKMIDDFIESRIKTTYIVLDPMFEDCVFERDAWYEKFRKAE